MPPDADPAEWSISDVAHWISHELPRLASTIPNARLPDTTALARYFSEQEISGHVLLFDVTASFLKEECFVKVHGHRSTILTAIRHLQNNSPTFALQSSHSLQRWNSSQTNVLQSVETPGPPPLPIRSPQITETKHTNPTVQDDSAFNNLPGPHARKRECIVVDTEGRKRRKLNLTVSVDPQHNTAAQSGFLPDSKLTLDGLMYGAVALGQPTVGLLDEQGSETDNFAFENPKHAQGTRLFAYSQMLHLFQASNHSKVEYNGRETHAILPYRKAQLPPGVPSSMTILSGPEDEDVALRFSEAMLKDELHPTGHQDSHEWDYLLDKYPNSSDDPTLPSYNNSDACSETSSLAAEMEEEETERALRMQGKLSRGDADSAIQAAIDELIDDYNVSKLPRLEERSAYRFWRSARATKGKGQRVKQQNKDAIKHLTARLEKMRRDILDQEWQSLKALKAQCAVLQPTVDDLHLEKWKDSVFKRPIQPQSLKGEVNSKTVPISSADVVECDNSDDMDAFIASDDESVGETIVSETSQLGSDSPLASGQVPPRQDVIHDTSIEERNRGHSRDVRPDTAVLSDDPADANRAQICDWDYASLERSMDRKRLLSKLIFSLERPIIEQMAGLLEAHEVGSRQWLQQMVAGFLMKGRHKPRPINGTSINSILLQFSKLYACWANCHHRYWDLALPDDLGNPIDVENLDGWSTYTAVQVPRIASFNEVEEEIDTDHDTDTDSDMPGDDIATPARKAKKPTKDKKAKQARRNAQIRMKKFHQSQLTNELEVSFSQVSSGGDDSLVVINVDRKDGEEAIYLNKTLARRLMPHQIDGVRMLWREIMLPKEEGPGCVLAHTMGVGKTCTAISLLITIMEASEVVAFDQSLPKDLFPLRALILCPPSLLQNWAREIKMWCPHGPEYFKVTIIDSTQAPQARLQMLQTWSQSTGILLIGYAIFQQLIKAGNIAREMAAGADLGAEQKSSKGLTDQQNIDAAEILKKSASIVFADEAHTFANARSGISIAINQMETCRRIAMTGTPMSNATKEIFSVVNWCSPGYLGSLARFQSYFGDPIERGNYADSSSAQKRKATMKLRILSEETAPKIHRKDIDTLKGTLPPKTEYVLTVPLTELQIAVYCKLVDCIQGHLDDQSADEKQAVSQVRLFGWLSLLILLSNHPKALNSRLLEKKIEKASKGLTPPVLDESVLDDDSDPVIAAAAADVHVSKLGFTAKVVHDLTDLIPQDAPIEASHRMALIIQILQLSLEAGDKVLVFSHRVPTLNYLEEQLMKHSVRFGRIDGSMSQPSRERTLQDLRSGELDVLLISTRAGGTGLNMQEANRVIFVDYGFNPTWEVQAVGRAYRLGQNKPVYVYRFVAGGTFEDKMYNLGVFKSQLSSKVVDKKNPNSYAQRDMKQWIHHPEDTTLGDLESERGKDPKVLDRLLSDQQEGRRDSYIRSILTMETLQKEAEDEPFTELEQQEVDQELEEIRTRRWPLRSHTRVAKASTLASTTTASEETPAKLAVKVDGVNTISSIPVASPKSSSPKKQINQGATSNAPPPKGFRYPSNTASKSLAGSPASSTGQGKPAKEFASFGPRPPQS